MMTVQLAFAQPWKMLAASQHFADGQAGEKFSSVSNHLPRIRRYRARPHYSTRSFQRQIKCRREVHVEPKSAAVLADDLTMLAIDFQIVHRKHLRRGRRRPQSIAEPVHAST